LALPRPEWLHGLQQGGVSFSAFTLDAAGEKLCGIFHAPKAGIITRIGFRLGNVGTGDTLRVSLQDVDAATGLPDGVQDQYRDVVVGSGDDNLWVRTGIITHNGTDGGTPRTVARDEALAVVVEFPSYVAGSLALSLFAAMAVRTAFGMQSFHALYTTSWTRYATAFGFAIEYSDGTFAWVPNAFPALTLAMASVSTVTAPDEIALRVSLPYPARCVGFWLASNIVAESADVVFYDAASNVLASRTIDKDMVMQAAAGLHGRRWASDVDLARDTVYRLAIKPTTTTASTIASVILPSNHGVALWDQIDGSRELYWSQRTDGGAWADDTLRRPGLGLLLSGFDDGVSSGGGLPIVGSAIVRAA